MSSAPQAAALSRRPDPHQDRPVAGGAAPSRTGRLLVLVRKLIDYGKGLVSTLPQRGAGTNGFDVNRRFGNFDFAAIIACITRGLRLAAALEVRLISHPVPPEKESTPSRAEKLRLPRTARPADRRAGSAESRVVRLPTPAQIAAALRRRPVGAVIAEICRDLGIGPGHEMWQEVAAAIKEYDGNTAALIITMFKRDRTCFVPRSARRATASAAASPPLPSASGAGPPEPWVRTNIAA